MGKNVISVPAFGEILTARPDGMDYGEYRDRLRAQCRRLKRRLRGVWVWKSKWVGGPVVEKSTGFRGESWGTATADRMPDLRIINDKK